MVHRLPRESVLIAFWTHQVARRFKLPTERNAEPGQRARRPDVNQARIDASGPLDGYPRREGNLQKRTDPPRRRFESQVRQPILVGRGLTTPTTRVTLTVDAR